MCNIFTETSYKVREGEGRKNKVLVSLYSLLSFSILFDAGRRYALEFVIMLYYYTMVVGWQRLRASHKTGTRGRKRCYFYFFYVKKQLRVQGKILGAKTTKTPTECVSRYCLLFVLLVVVSLLLVSFFCSQHYRAIQPQQITRGRFLIT